MNRQIHQLNSQANEHVLNIENANESRTFS